MPPSDEACLVLFSLLALAVLAPACSRKPSPSEASTGAAPKSSLPRSNPVECIGKEIHDCVRTKGCLLDQPTYKKPECRPAENRCESAVRQADLIGPDADPGVTPEAIATAEAACNATSGCAPTSGKCSCPCALLGNCNCACGGSYLRRCTTRHEQPLFDGRPPAEGAAGPLARLGDALVKVRRVHGLSRYVTDPLPASDLLLGKSRQEIESVLGTPFVCEDTTTAPCRNTHQVFYSFYRLPPGTRGGGPELLLSYDEKSVCREARYEFTR